jgi:hypothetical protein
LYVLDGKEKLDISNPEKVSNGMGGFNSVLKAGVVEESSTYLLLKLQEHDDNVIYISYENTVTEFIVNLQKYKIR